MLLVLPNAYSYPSSDSINSILPASLTGLLPQSHYKLYYKDTPLQLILYCSLFYLVLTTPASTLLGSDRSGTLIEVRRLMSPRAPYRRLQSHRSRLAFEATTIPSPPSSHRTPHA